MLKTGLMVRVVLWFASVHIFITANDAMNTTNNTKSGMGDGCDDGFGGAECEACGIRAYSG
eukprot:1591129-Rhodomonas_salina.1